MCAARNKRPLLIVLDSDIDEEEIQSFVTKKVKKMRKLKKRKAGQKSSSVSSSPSLSSPQDSDANSSSVVNGALPPCSEQDHLSGLKRKKNIACEANAVNIGKKAKLTNSDSELWINTTVKSNIEAVKNDSRMTKAIAPVPAAWRSVNSSHYIFVSDEDSDDGQGSSTLKVKLNSTLENKVGLNHYKTKVTTHQGGTSLTNSENIRTSTTTDKPYKAKGQTSVNGKRISQLWYRKDDRANTNHDSVISNKTLTKARRLSCLTNCKCCVSYSLPVLTDEENREMGSYIALDCEFVGVGPKSKSALGRCSIINHRGEILYDQFVKPVEPVTDYRTRWSGLRPRNINCGIPFVAAQEQIAAVIKDKIVVGHAVHNDFRVMEVPHPVHLIRDTASCKLLQEMANLPGNVCALRKLTGALLGRCIQRREHCSVTDARACMDLFRLVWTEWEPVLQAKCERRKVRHTLKEAAEETDSQPKLVSYLDDQYWPVDMFDDTVGQE